MAREHLDLHLPGLAGGAVSQTDLDHEEATCKHCRRPIWRRVSPELDEWAHYPGSRYCITRNGFTNEGLLVATPMSHPEEGFDEGDYEGPYAVLGNTVFGPASVTKRQAQVWSCNRCATVTVDRGKHDKHCPGRKELR